MTVVAGLVAIVLVLLAALHLYWGMGGVWPGTDEKTCARAIAGFRGIDRMPSPIQAFTVAGALLAGAAAALVFLGRGIAGYTPAWRRLTPEMPFARNDVRYFSPLCLLLGVSFVVLLSQGASA